MYMSWTFEAFYLSVNDTFMKNIGIYFGGGYLPKLLLKI